eukprot:40709-Rhodomonas_salina.2
MEPVTMGDGSALPGPIRVIAHAVGRERGTSDQVKATETRKGNRCAMLEKSCELIDKAAVRACR